MIHLTMDHTRIDCNRFCIYLFIYLYCNQFWIFYIWVYRGRLYNSDEYSMSQSRWTWCWPWSCILKNQQNTKLYSEESAEYRFVFWRVSRMQILVRKQQGQMSENCDIHPSRCLSIWYIINYGVQGEDTDKKIQKITFL